MPRPDAGDLAEDLRHLPRVAVHDRVEMSGQHPRHVPWDATACDVRDAVELALLSDRVHRRRIDHGGQQQLVGE